MPWNIADEVIKQNKDLYDSGVKFVIAVPELRILWNLNIANSKKRIKVLITGANGFVGSKIVKGLPHKDVEVIAVLRNFSNQKIKYLT